MPAIRTGAWPRRPKQNEQDDPALVGQWEWCRLIPNVHRLLANSSEQVWFPRWRADFDLNQACAYWEPAYYVLRRLVGWQDLGLGLQWFFHRDRDADGDPRLALIRELWDDNDQLAQLAMWAWVHGGPGESRRAESFVDRAFYQSFLERGAAVEGDKGYGPFGVGTNPLHLSHSCLSCNPGDPIMLRTEPAQRRAVLVVDHAAAWSPALVHCGAQLPGIGDRSWHVDVFAKPIGWLGTFRQSRDTGLWFQGKHSTHAAGNP